MKIGVRLAVSFGTILVIVVALCAFTADRLSYVNSQLDTITSDKWPKTVLINEINDNINTVARLVRDAILANDPVAAKNILARVPPIAKVSSSDFTILEKTVNDEEAKALLQEIQVVRGRYKVVQKDVFAAIEANKNKEAVALVKVKYGPLQDEYMAAMKKMTALLGKHVSEAGKSVKSATDWTRDLSILFSAITVLLGAAFAYLVTRSITKPVAQLLSLNARLADGDLTVKFDLGSKDEMGQLAGSSRRVVENLHDILTQVANTSGLVASASHQLKATADQIAAGAEEVAGQTSTVATASEEMAATCSDIARSCSLAVSRSHQSSASATKGGSVVQDTIAGMSRIARQVKQSAKTVENLGMRSEQIGEIVGTIEDIADQTNLLALNAAIEAARAGDQGRGFAVVADEVRALAERTTRATKEISEMIRTIQKETRAAVVAMEDGVAEVEKGAESSEKSGEALKEILEQINEVTMQINQIATSAEEQTATTSEISRNVQQVTEVVQETSRGAHDTAAASAQLSGNAQLLQSLVQKFRL